MSDNDSKEELTYTEFEKIRHEIERQLIGDNCGILYINDSATIKNFKEEQ